MRSSVGHPWLGGIKIIQWKTRLELHQAQWVKNYHWKESLSETDIFARLGPVTPEAGLDGLKGIIIPHAHYLKLGIIDAEEKDDTIPFSGTMRPKPYTEVNLAGVMDEVKKFGCSSDFHPHRLDIEKYQESQLLLMLDPTSVYGERWILCTTVAAYEREKARIKMSRQTVVDEYSEALRKDVAASGVGKEPIDEDESIIVQDLPKVCFEWKSPTMEKTHQEVMNFTVVKSRQLMRVVISRPRAQFGRSYKLSDSGSDLPQMSHSCRPAKDPNFRIKKELEIGIQSVTMTKMSSCQTTWHRPVNKSTQYCKEDFMHRAQIQAVASVEDFGVTDLLDFLSEVSVTVEEALQTNETVDIFKEEFEQLGDDETGIISKTSSNIKEQRNFHDVNYTRNRRIEWVEWVPNTTDMLACSCCDNMPFNEKVEYCGKATSSHILIWSFLDSLAPRAILVSPWEVPVFKFYPSDDRFLLGGVSSGQLIVWKLSPVTLGPAVREKRNGLDDEKNSAIPSIAHKHISAIDESHRRPVLAIEWLPSELEFERRGRAASEKNPRDGHRKYCLTIAGDGQLLIWDFSAVLDALDDSDFVWKPMHRIQLLRQDSACVIEMGCCHVLYCHDRFDEKGIKHLNNFYASTEEAELIFGDWAARVEEDRKPEFCKEIYTVSKTFRPMLSLERSPFFKDLLLAVTDWAFYLWKEGEREHLFQSCYTSNYFTRGVWSPTRPSVIFLGLQTGGIDIWDFSDQSHKASLSDPGDNYAISSMVFLKHGDMYNDQKIAVGHSHGHLHVHTIPKNLSRQAGKEYETMKKFIEREEKRVKYFRIRKQELVSLKEQMEKQAQNAGVEDENERNKKADEEEDKFDVAAEEAYQKLEQDCREQLSSSRFSFLAG